MNGVFLFIIIILFKLFNGFVVIGIDFYGIVNFDNFKMMSFKDIDILKLKIF